MMGQVVPWEKVDLWVLQGYKVQEAPLVHPVHPVLLGHKALRAHRAHLDLKVGIDTFYVIYY